MSLLKLWIEFELWFSNIHRLLTVKQRVSIILPLPYSVHFKWQSFDQLIVYTMFGGKVGLRVWRLETKLGAGVGMMNRRQSLAQVLVWEIGAKIEIKSVETRKIVFKDFWSRNIYQITNQRGRISRYAKLDEAWGGQLPGTSSQRWRHDF